MLFIYYLQSERERERAVERKEERDTKRVIYLRTVGWVTNESTKRQRQRKKETQGSEKSTRQNKREREREIERV